MMANGSLNSLRAFLCTAVRLPARLTVTETSILLGFSEHDIRVLVAASLLKPLGDPAKNAPKYFAAAQVQECAADIAWLSKATKTVAKHWKTRNDRPLQLHETTT